MLEVYLVMMKRMVSLVILKFEADKLIFILRLNLLLNESKCRLFGFQQDQIAFNLIINVSHDYFTYAILGVS